MWVRVVMRLALCLRNRLSHDRPDLLQPGAGTKYWSMGVSQSSAFSRDLTAQYLITCVPDLTRIDIAHLAWSATADSVVRSTIWIITTIIMISVNFVWSE